MNAADLAKTLELPRKRTLELLDGIVARPDAANVLGWRPAPGRAHIAWQLMHIGATDDRHVHVRMAVEPGTPAQPALVDRFAGGSTPDDNIPSVEEIRTYLADSRKTLLGFLQGISDAQLPTKPRDNAMWTYHDWILVLAWHEAHHQGQAHLTFNMYKAAFDAK